MTGLYGIRYALLLYWTALYGVFSIIDLPFLHALCGSMYGINFLAKWNTNLLKIFRCSKKQVSSSLTFFMYSKGRISFGGHCGKPVKENWPETILFSFCFVLSAFFRFLGKQHLYLWRLVRFACNCTLYAIVVILYAFIDIFDCETLAYGFIWVLLVC